MHIGDAIAPLIGDNPSSEHAAQAAQWAVEIDGDQTVGHLGSAGDVELHDHTFFDIASVSKLFTATAAKIAIDRGLVALDTPLRSAFPDAANGDATLAHLLNHSSGLPAWDKYYERLPWPDDQSQAMENRAEILRQILEQGALIKPGFNGTYSDLGFMLLGRWMEHLFDKRLDEIVEETITGPLAMQNTCYVFCRAPISPAVRTELDDRRPHVTDSEGAVCGVVHDENCYIQGGVAGHAGLFSTATDLLRFGTHMRDIANGEEGIVRMDTLRSFWDRTRIPPGGHHVLGWDTPSGERTSVGQGFSREQTFGHLGFTGTSLWIDRSTHVVAVLLTNRVFPTRLNDNILDLRIRFHEAVQP